MTTSKHTPGPWRCFTIRRVRHIYRVNEIGRPFQFEIATMRGDPRGFEENEANASLIAAAPDLLKALEDAMPWIAARVADSIGVGVPVDGHPVYRAASEALTKAKGGAR